MSFKTTTKRKLSEYIRYVLLDKPITVYTRNQSFDDILASLNGLKNELRPSVTTIIRRSKDSIQWTGFQR
ncbi:MAG: hypothetical protein WDO71_19190 [Bacteroidota bacterium]